jgi:transcriptional regulator with XRE-family HTH domain
MADDQVAAFHASFEWRSLLREQRERRRLSQTELASHAGVSASAIKAYENGSRHPTPEALSALIEALGVPPEQANRIRAGAGYSVDLRWLIHGRYASRELHVLQEQAERYPWPVWLVNVTADVLVANRALFAALGPELTEWTRAHWPVNQIATASEPRFADRVANWDEAVTFMVGIAKGEQRLEHNMERPASIVAEAVTKFLSGDPNYVRRLLSLWESAPPVDISMRMHYPWHWRAPDGRVMRFLAVLHRADIWNELTWGDWIPQDAETWTILAELKDGAR